MTAAATATLPHTQLRVPHDRIRLVAPGLVGLDGSVAGVVAIDLDDGDFVETYVPVDGRLSEGEWFDFAAGCRTETGDPLDGDTVLDYLRAEWSTQNALVRAGLAGVTVAQAMVPYGGGYLPGPVIRVEQHFTRQYVIHLAEDVDAPTGSWWRIYNGSEWVELDPNNNLGGQA